MKNEKINSQNIWKYYPKSFASITPRIQKELLEFTANQMYGEVLDAGCGVGKLIPYLFRNKKIKNISVVDYEIEMILESKKLIKRINKNNKINLEYFIGDVTNLKFNNNVFDSISSLNVFYTLNEPNKFLSESYRILRNNGKLILSSPTKNVENNMKKLEEEIELEFKNNSEFEIFKECNSFLMSQFKPKLFSTKEIINKLKKYNFKIEDIIETHYLNSNYTIIAKKIKK